MSEMDEQILEDLYTWIDQIPLTRPKKDLKRDFSDGVLVAEVIKYFHPHLVELHNYPMALGISKKAINWHMLNRKVFKKLGFEVNDDVIHNITTCKQWAIEQFLLLLRQKVSNGAQQSRPSPAGGGDIGQGPVIFSPSVESPPASAPQRSKPVQKPAVIANGNARFSPPSSRAAPPPPPAPPVGQLGDDFVPRVLLDDKLQEVLAKDETIQILNAKIRRLEHLIQIKDIRIQDLQTRMQHMEMVAAGGVGHAHPPANHTSPGRSGRK